MVFRSAVTYFDVCPSPVGDLVLMSDGRSLTGLMMTNQRHTQGVQPGWVRESGPFVEARSQLGQYFAGERTEFELELAPTGTPFQVEVWRTLRDIPYGTTINYGELAKRIGNANASRAVGAANGRNPIGIIVPCHRVIGANGSLVGYGGGLERKKTLLALERDTLAKRGERLV